MTLTSEAEDDLAAIWQYTAETWDEQQADTYAEFIRSKLADLARFPRIGRPRDELSPGLRSHPIGQHVAFYRTTNDELIVRRLFHGRQDIDDEPGL
ncbi:MAG: type II toxin-antitoxin system RelE/ParE family toxin [Thermomicrobiales bacterium]